MPSQREAITQQACDHTHEVWILGQVRPSHYAIADMQLIRGNHASLVAVLPPNSLILHAPSCWSDAKWDGAPSNYAAQIWYLPRYDKSRCPGVRTTATAGSDANLPLSVQHKLGRWDSRRYDFYSSIDDPWRPLQCYRETAGRLSIVTRRALSCHRWESLPPERAYGHQLCPRRESWICRKTWICSIATILGPCWRTVSYTAG